MTKIFLGKYTFIPLKLWFRVNGEALVLRFKILEKKINKV